jgi:hypothetical protein
MTEAKEVLSPGAETAMGAPKLPNPKWPRVKDWGIGEWGSLASIVGVGLWLFDQAVKLGKKSKTA